MWCSIVLQSDLESCDSQLRENELTGIQDVDSESERRFAEAVMRISDRLAQQAGW